MRNNKKTEFTSSTLWLLPMYRISMAEWKRAGITDAYLQDEVKTDKMYEGLTVRLLFQVDEQKYQLIEDAISTIPEFLDMYGLGDELIVVVLRIPEEFEGDYELIMQGEYSSLSPEYRELVSDRLIDNKAGTYKTNGKRLQLLIMEKSSQVKQLVAKTAITIDNIAEGQVWEKFDMKREVITERIINQLINE